VLVAIVAGVLVFGAGGHRRGVPPPVNQATLLRQEADAVRIVGRLTAGDYRAVALRYPSGTLGRRYPTRLSDQWQHCVAAYGPFRSQGRPTGGDGTVTVPLTMTGGRIDVLVYFDQNGRLSSLTCQGAAETPAVTRSVADQEAQAANLVAQLALGRFHSAWDALDPVERTYVDAERLRTLWQSFEQAYGPFIRQGPTSYSTYSLFVPVSWAHATSRLLVFLDANYEVAGFTILLPDASPGALYGDSVPAGPAAVGRVAVAVEQLAGGQFGAVARALDPVGAATTNSDDLEGEWRAATTGLGGRHRAGPPVLIGSGSNYVDYEVELRFDGGTAHVQVPVDSRGRLGAPTIGAGPATGVTSR
jgi:hypothetical protein